MASGEMWLQGNCSDPPPGPLPSAVPIDAQRLQCVIIMPPQGLFPYLHEEVATDSEGDRRDQSSEPETPSALWISGLYFMASGITRNGRTAGYAAVMEVPGALYITDAAFVGPMWFPREDRLKVDDEVDARDHARALSVQMRMYMSSAFSAVLCKTCAVYMRLPQCIPYAHTAYSLHTCAHYGLRASRVF